MFFLKHISYSFHFSIISDQSAVCTVAVFTRPCSKKNSKDLNFCRLIGMNSSCRPCSAAGQFNNMVKCVLKLHLSTVKSLGKL